MKFSRLSCVKLKQVLFKNVLNRRFVLTYQNVNGEFIERNGIVTFYSEQNKLIVPMTLRIKPELIGKNYTAMIRDYDNGFIYKIEDEVNWDCVDEQKDFIIETQKDIDNLLERMFKLKEVKLTTIQSLVGMEVGTILFTLIVKFIFENKFLFQLGTAMIVVLLIAVIPYIISFPSFVVYDLKGKWIDLNTGETNLNGGKIKFSGQLREYNEEDNIDDSISI